MPKNVLTVGWEDQPYAKALLPQAWAFFTRDPKSESLILFDDQSPSLDKRADSLPQTSSQNYFGLTRNQRSQDTEKALLSKETSNWTECGGMTTNECLEEAALASPARVSGANRSPNFCGDYILALVEPVRFNFRESTDETHVANKAAHIEVECKGDDA